MNTDRDKYLNEEREREILREIERGINQIDR